MKQLTLLLILATLFSTCGDDDDTVDPYNAELALEIVTGIQLRDANAAPIGQLGNPNTRAEEVDIYPNPALGVANILYFGGASLQVQQYWIFAADPTTEYANVDYQTVLANDTYSADEVSDLNVVQTNVVNQSSFAVNLEDLTAGYYRIFYLMSNGTLLWDNLYVDPNGDSPELLVNEIAGDW